jgi:hypothetical protein
MLKDKEKYRELQLDAAEIMLGYFGFDRTVYRDLPKKNGKGGTSLGKDAERTLRVVCTDMFTYHSSTVWYASRF